MVSLPDLLIVWFTIGLPVLIGIPVAKRFGILPGILVGLVSLAFCLFLAAFNYRIRRRISEQRRREWKQKYSSVYRVKELPSNALYVKKPKDAKVQIGDYGWEAVPLSDNGLIYLQGLNLRWRVVWYAGFRLDQVEKIAVKPLSQYDWDKSWIEAPPPCPFPIQERETSTMGLPMPH